MLITREMLLEDRARYEKQKNDALAAANANAGAMDAIDILLDRLNQPEAAEKVENESENK